MAQDPICLSALRLAPNTKHNSRLWISQSQQRHRFVCTFVNLATATASDRQMLSDLTATNKEFTKHLATKDTEIKDLKAKIQELQCNGPSCNTRNRDSHENNRGSTTPWFNNLNYCLTHGHNISINHTSQGCIYPGNGHQRNATKTNTKGGSKASKSRAT
jgi:hypothetical protein